mmetsp:Transcript_78606/g.163375  ORF Transcript_78606/g.163375 Transcript_78606/m.163375 type:complete len:364 (-) Transcript_78606:370-1461(-)
MVKRLRIVGTGSKQAKTDGEGAEEEQVADKSNVDSNGADAQAKKKKKVRTGKMRRDAKKRREAAELEERHKTLDPEHDPKEEPYLAFRVFVKGLPPAVDEQKLKKRFEKHGKVRWIKLIKNSRKQFMGSALVCYQQEKFQEKALAEDGKHFGGKELSVKKAEILQRKEATQKEEHQVFVAGLPFTTTRQTLKKDFDECGKVLKLRMLMDSTTGDFRGMAFITYGKESEMNEALKYNGTQYGGRKISVQIAGQKEDPHPTKKDKKDKKDKASTGKNKDNNKDNNEDKSEGKKNNNSKKKKKAAVAPEGEDAAQEEQHDDAQPSKKEKDKGKRKAEEMAASVAAEGSEPKKKKKNKNGKTPQGSE